MKHARQWMTVAAGAAVGILLTACLGETAKQKEAPPATTTPKPNTAVHKSYFASARGQAWIKSTDSMFNKKHPSKKVDLAWINAAGKKYTIVEAACMDDSGNQLPCHLEVIIDAAGQSKPARTLEVKKGAVGGTYDIEVTTEKDDSQFMICKGLAENPSNNQAIKGSCDIYPVKLDDLNPSHSFCAHTEVEDNGTETEDDDTLEISYRFTHKDCDQSSGDIHNGNGHAN